MSHCIYMQGLEIIPIINYNNFWFQIEKQTIKISQQRKFALNISKLNYFTKICHKYVVVILSIQKSYIALAGFRKCMNKTNVFSNDQFIIVSKLTWFRDTMKHW